MIPTIQDEIREAKKLADLGNASLEQLIDAMPHCISINGEDCFLSIAPMKGGLHFVSYRELDGRQKPQLHVDGIGSITGAVIEMIEMLWENRNNIKEIIIL